MTQSTLTDRISSNVRAVLAANHITMTDLAKRIGKRSTYVITRLNGIVEISTNDLQAFATELGYTPEELVSEPFTLHPINSTKTPQDRG